MMGILTNDDLDVLSGMMVVMETEKTHKCCGNCCHYMAAIQWCDILGRNPYKLPLYATDGKRCHNWSIKNDG